MGCAAAIAAIRVTLRDRLPERAAELGEYFLGRLREIAGQYPQIYSSITGKGLLIAQHFCTPEIGYEVGRRGPESGNRRDVRGTYAG